MVNIAQIYHFGKFYLCQDATAPTIHSHGGCNTDGCTCRDSSNDVGDGVDENLQFLNR